MKLIVSRIANQAFFGVFLMAIFFAASVAGQSKKELTPTVGTAVKFDVSKPLRNMKPLDTPRTERKGKDDRGDLGPVNDNRHDPDQALQRFAGEGLFSGPSAIPPTNVSFDGLIQSGGSTPPDTVGDVGPNHYVQMVNSRFQVFSKTGTSLFGPASINTIFAGFGGACQTENAGDPVVLYDQLADRWLLTQFTAAGPNYFNCVALSQTSDPTGSYYRYAFSNGTKFPDYPKYGVWSDGYYISTRDFANGTSYTGVGAYALNRDQMILGIPTPQVVSFFVPRGSEPFKVGDGLLPADIDGNTMPPAGSAQYFLGTQDLGGPYSAASDALNLFKFSVNWTTPASSTFSLANTIPMAAFDTVFPCTPSSRACIPQPGTATKIDILSYRQRPLHRLAYRNLGTHESLVTNQSVEATAGIAGIRWWEIRSPSTSPVIHQEGTYSPDSVHRWMGSVAMDRKGNMLLGYSVSDVTSVFPGIRFTGRLASDPLGTMPQGEGVMMNGAGSQTSTGNRWGDYSSMNVDSVDDCTFWYTTEYYQTTSTVGYRTRISSVTFPNCLAPSAQFVRISGRVATADGIGVSGANVKLAATGTGALIVSRTNGFGYFFFDNVPSNETYTLAAVKKRFSIAPRVIFANDNIDNADLVATPE